MDKTKLLKRNEQLAQLIKKESWETRTQQEIDYIQSYVNENTSFLVELTRIALKIPLMTQAGFNARVEFIKHIEADYDLERVIKCGLLIEVTGLSSRTIDDCTEMGDGALVISALRGQVDLFKLKAS